MRRQATATKKATSFALAAALALAGCTANDLAGTAAAPGPQGNDSTASIQAHPTPGGVVRRGDSFATMADQYTPGAGSVVATGASAWVEPAPPPAFVAAGVPPRAAPPAPTPAAVANREPSSPAPAAPAVPISDIARPEAPAPDAPAASPDPALREAGLALFNNYSCGACHVLADAGAGGSIGPSLDRNPRLTRDLAVDVIANGRGAMPSFAGQMTDEEINALADYIVQFAR